MTLAYSPAANPSQTQSSVPQVFKRRDVDFVVGVQLVAEVGDRAAQTLMVGTNLAGAAVGTVVGELSGGLKHYFTNFVSFDVGLPLNDDANVSSSVGLGLGELTVGKVNIWPVLGMDQFNPEDIRLPSAVAATNPGASDWSSPVLGIGIALKSTDSASSATQAAATLSVGFPQYFAGSGLSGLKALVTNERKEFVRAGKARLAIGIAMPIPRLN